MGWQKELIRCELLVLRCRRNDHDAWQDLIGHWERRLFYYVRRMVDNEQDAWDILQQTWLAAHKGIGTLRDARSLPKWLYRTARNLTLMHRRRTHPHETLEAAEAQGQTDPCGDNGPEARFDNAELVHQALDWLPLPQREVLTLYFLQDLSVTDIAEVTGVPEGTVKSRLHYAKRALRRVIDGTDGGAP